MDIALKILYKIDDLMKVSSILSRIDLKQKRFKEVIEKEEFIVCIKKGKFR